MRVFVCADRVVCVGVFFFLGGEGGASRSLVVVPLVLSSVFLYRFLYLSISTGRATAHTLDSSRDDITIHMM